MSDSRGKSDDAGTFDAAARAMGRAVGYFRRLYSKDEKDAEAQKDAGKRRKPDKTKKKTARRRGRDKVPAQPTRATAPAAAAPAHKPAHLEQEISRKEEELDRVYAAIASGGSEGLARSVGAGPDQLSELIQRARELKQELSEHRTDLARLQRAAARERALKRTEAPPTGKAGLPEPPPDTSRVRSGRKRGGSKARPERVEGTAADPAQEIRREVARLAMGDESLRLLVERVARNLVDPNADVRRTATVRLGELDLPQTAGLLVPLVSDPADKVAIAALNALVRLGNPASAELFRRHLGSDNLHIRLAALRGVAKVGEEGAVTHLADALDDDEPAIRKAAATLLGWREAGDAVRPLL